MGRLHAGDEISVEDRLVLDLARWITTPRKHAERQARLKAHVERLAELREGHPPTAVSKSVLVREFVDWWYDHPDATEAEQRARIQELLDWRDQRSGESLAEAAGDEGLLVFDAAKAMFRAETPNGTKSR